MTKALDYGGKPKNPQRRNKWRKAMKGIHNTTKLRTLGLKSAYAKLPEELRKKRVAV